MNPLDIYRILPRINCGECPAGTCMAFAVRLSGGEAQVSECVKLTEGARDELMRMLSDSEPGDWKERYLEELIDEFSRINLNKVADGIGAEVKGEALVIRYMGRDVMVSASGIDGGLDIWDKLLVLMYIRNAGGRRPSGRWIAFRDLKDGSIKSAGFRAMCEEPLSRMFDKDRERLLRALSELGAERIGGYSTEHSYIIHPLPMIPFLILLWPAEEEFATQCSVLLDETATDFLDVEALTFLGQALVRALKRLS
jgi:hypothetical protein